MKRGLLVMILAVLACGMVFSAGTKEASDDGTVKITYYNTSAEVNTMFEDMFARYHELHPDVTIELIPTGVGQGQQEKLQSLYASGNAPTFMNIDPANVIEYQETLLELTEENAAWLSLANESAVQGGTFGGKVMGAPWSVQGFGLLYNKRLVNNIYNGSFDPASINTRDALKAFFEKVEASGVSASLLHAANWSVGGHYLTLVYAVQGPETSDGTGFIDKLKTGAVKIEDSPIFQGYMDTFDLLKEHNYNKADPLVADYNRDVQAFGEGKAATFFMGDWTWTVMGTLDGVDQEYGFIPVPWSNNPGDYGNTEVVMVLPKFQVVNKSQNSPAQQKAALDVLGWMLTEPEGQQFFIDTGFSMPYKNVRKDVEYNSMTSSVAEYAMKGKTINLGCFSYITGDAWTQTGNLMLKYLSNVIDRDELAKGIDDYWSSLD